MQKKKGFLASKLWKRPLAVIPWFAGVVAIMYGYFGDVEYVDEAISIHVCF